MSPTWNGYTYIYTKLPRVRQEWISQRKAIHPWCNSVQQHSKMKWIQPGLINRTILGFFWHKNLIHFICKEKRREGFSTPKSTPSSNCISASIQRLFLYATAKRPVPWILQPLPTRSVCQNILPCYTPCLERMWMRRTAKVIPCCTFWPGKGMILLKPWNLFFNSICAQMMPVKEWSSTGWTFSMMERRQLWMLQLLASTFSQLEKTGPCIPRPWRCFTTLSTMMPSISRRKLKLMRAKQPFWTYFNFTITEPKKWSDILASFPLFFASHILHFHYNFSCYIHFFINSYAW